MSQYDYVIVGAGSAGCVLAHRLSSDPTKSVCLIEAGPRDKNPLIHIPFGLSLINHIKSINWGFETSNEKQLGGRNLFWPRGKTLGGSSSINAMCYIRGNPQNYDDWAQTGCKNWDWQSVLPYFLKAEGNTRGKSKLHGEDGPLSVSDLRHINPLTLDFIESGKRLGMSENSDFNGLEQDGIGLYQVTQKGGERCSTAKGYLTEDVKARPNLHVVTGAEVKRVILNENKAIGVAIKLDNQEVEYLANDEVILSAGAIGSPQILMQSGIGDPETLSAVDIECVHPLAAVGKNLQDHLDITLLFRQKKSTSYGFSIRRFIKDSIAPLQYMFKRKGMLTTNVAEGAAFFKSNDSLELPDIQVHFLPALLEDHGRKKLWGHGFTIHVCNLYPKSTGQITLTKDKSSYNPVIDANYLDHPDDLEPLVKAFKWARDIAGESPLSNGTVEFKPGINVDNDEQIKDYIRNNAETLYHPVGTCKMGSDEDDSAVVDSKLRVKGIKNLRVVDASVMPTIVGGNTNAPTVMIAEKAADLIIE